MIIVAFKVMDNLKVDHNQAISFNYLSGFVYGSLLGEWPENRLSIIDYSWYYYALIIGFVFVSGFVLFSKSTVRAGVSITAVSSKMSVIIPVIAGFLFFGDAISALKLIGILLAIISFFFIFKPENKEKINYNYIYLPLALLVVSGLNDLFVKYIQFKYLSGDILVFLSIVFLAAFGFGLIFSFVTNKKNASFISLSGVFGGIVLGTFNFWNAWAMIKSMEFFETSILFPLINVGVVSLAALIGFAIFKERLKLVNWIGIFIAMVAILIMSIGNAG